MPEDGGNRWRAAGRLRYRSRSPWIYLLFLPPFPALLYPPFYAHVHPALGGVPFFIWYQFAWVIVTALLTAAVYKLRTGLPFFGSEAGIATEPSSDQTEPGGARSGS